MDSALEASRQHIRVGTRFNGPPETANGGVVAGLLASVLGSETTEVTLRRPPPIGDALPLERRAGELHALDPASGAIVAVAKPATHAIEPPCADSDLRIVGPAPKVSTPVGSRTCFVCGTDRDTADGLRLVARPTATAGVSAVEWTPHLSLPTEAGRVAAPLVWAALDCPGLFAILPGEPRLTALLGRITATVRARPRPGERCLVTGWSLGGERRKRFTGTALFSAERALLAHAEAVWIAGSADPGC